MLKTTASSASSTFGATGLRSALQALPDAVAIVDLSGRIGYVNASFEAAFGYASDALLGRSLEFLFEDEDERREMEATLFSAEALAAPRKDLAKYRRENGDIFPGETTSSRVLDDRGVCIGVIAVIRDVGEQRLADETLHGLYALSSAPELFAEEKVERILYLGAAYYGLENAVIGQVVDDQYRVDYALGSATRRGRAYPLSQTLCSGLLASGGAVSVLDGPAALAGRSHLGLDAEEVGAYVGAPVFVNDRAVGSLSFFGRIGGRPLPAGAADFAQLFAHWIGYQLTREKVLEELRAAHEAAQENYRVAEAASRAKSRFLATMSHELRTPLNAILGFADLTAGRLHGESSEKYFEYAADISGSATKLLGMIDDLLSMSRLDTGAIELVEEIFDPIEEIQVAVMKHRPAATQAGLELTAAPDAPRMTLRAERKAFRQVLGNLIANAIKFTKSGGVHVDVVVDAKGGAVIRVIDTGCGIPESELSRVFYPFERNDGDDSAMTANAGGSGLGLTICRELMEAHDGALTLASVVDQGTIASMVWPAERIAFAEELFAAVG